MFFDSPQKTVHDAGPHTTRKISTLPNFTRKKANREAEEEDPHRPKKPGLTDPKPPDDVTRQQSAHVSVQRAGFLVHLQFYLQL